mmetsp:Transcript_24346/g.39470  ORF Transcript_24346/g.39470 Transcript_24346/m.39470 type:complete len:509 (-) Transcript_24346:1322-2848(-)
MLMMARWVWRWSVFVCLLCGSSDLAATSVRVEDILQNNVHLGDSDENGNGDMVWEFADGSWKVFGPEKIGVFKKTTRSPVVASSVDLRDYVVILEPLLPEDSTSESPKTEGSSGGNQSYLGDRSYLLTTIGSTSVFVLIEGPSGERIVVERFFNGKKWVWVGHRCATDSYGQIMSVTSSSARVYSVTSKGFLLERRRTTLNTLEWYVVDDYKFTSSGHPSSRRGSNTFFFLNDEGRILERVGPSRFLPVQPGKAEIPPVKWHQYTVIGPEKHYSKKLSHIVDVESLQPNLIFFSAWDGSLLEGILNHRAKTIKLRNLGWPPGLKLGPSRGFVVKNPKTNTRSLFMVSTDGHLVEFVVYALDKGHRWTVHGRPSPEQETREDTRIVVSPGPGCAEVSVFVVTGSGFLVQRIHQGSGWAWVNHSSPFVQVLKDPEDPTKGKIKKHVPLKPALGQSLGPNSLWFMLQDGRVAERVMKRTKWIWVVHEIPEFGKASYCVADPNSANSCLKIS